VSDGNNKHSSVGKPYEIDQRAIKVFLSGLSDIWLPRKQDPDFFVDYLVEIVENGEPTGLHFAAQVKGYEDAANEQKLLSYSFKTKHLKYYLNRSQHPVFLFLINVTTREGYWLFAQKYLKEKASAKVLDEQASLTIHFSAEDSLFNFTKFKCLLSEAEQFVRDLHPGSVQAALQKRKAELESKDPRCEVSISIKDGKEHLTISAKEPFLFQTKIRTQNVEGWRKFFESGAEVRVEPGEIEIIGAPLLEEAFKKMGGFSKFQFGTEHSAAIQFFCGAGENLTAIQMEGKIRAGTKFITFSGGLPQSPAEISGELPFDIKFQDEASSHFTFSLDKWTGQRMLLLSHFDQVEKLVRSLIASYVPKMEISVLGNILWTGHLNDLETESLKGILYPIDLLQKCRWIAQHFNINPVLPRLTDVSKVQWDTVKELYGLLKNKEISISQAGQIISFVTSGVPPDKGFLDSGTLVIEKEEQTVDFFGASVPLGPTRHILNDLKFISRTPLDKGGTKFVFETTDTTKQTSILH
jgi:hypothetical protein